MQIAQIPRWSRQYRSASCHDRSEECHHLPTGGPAALMGSSSDQFGVQPLSVEDKLIKSTGAFSKWDSIPNSWIPTFHLLSSWRNRQWPTDVPKRLGCWAQLQLEKVPVLYCVGDKTPNTLLPKTTLPWTSWPCCKWNSQIAWEKCSLGKTSHVFLPGSVPTETSYKVSWT